MAHHPNLPNFDDEWSSHVLKDPSLTLEADNLFSDLGINLDDIVQNNMSDINEADIADKSMQDHD